MYEIEYTDLIEIIEFFHRPDKEMYGTAMMYSKEYDFFSCAYYPFAYSTGGKIWDPATSDVYGILNSDINATAMDQFIGLMKFNQRMLLHLVSVTYSTFSTAENVSPLGNG